jgi:hypothetical protein
MPPVEDTAVIGQARTGDHRLGRGAADGRDADGTGCLEQYPPRLWPTGWARGSGGMELNGTDVPGRGDVQIDHWEQEAVSNVHR